MSWIGIDLSNKPSCWDAEVRFQRVTKAHEQRLHLSLSDKSVAPGYVQDTAGSPPSLVKAAGYCLRTGQQPTGSPLSGSPDVRCLHRLLVWGLAQNLHSGHSCFKLGSEIPTAATTPVIQYVSID